MSRHAFLTLTLAGLLLLVARPARAATEPDVGFDRYLPDDATLVATIDFDALFDSPLGKKFALRFMASFLNHDSYGDFLGYPEKEKKKLGNVFRSLGYNPATDTSSATIVATRADERLGANHPTFLAFRGKFDPVKINATLETLVKERAEWMKIHTAGDRKIYESTWTYVGDRPWFAAVPDRSGVVVSLSKSHVLDVIDKVDGRKKSLMRRELRDALRKPPAGRFLGITALREGILRAVPEKDSSHIRKQLEKLRIADFSAIATDEIGVELYLDFEDAETSRSFEKTATDLLAAAKLFVSLEERDKNPGADIAAKFLDDVKITTQDRAVTLKSRVGKDVIDDGFKKLLRMGKQKPK